MEISYETVIVLVAIPLGFAFLHNLYALTGGRRNPFRAIVQGGGRNNRRRNRSISDQFVDLMAYFLDVLLRIIYYYIVRSFYYVWWMIYYFFRWLARLLLFG